MAFLIIHVLSFCGVLAADEATVKFFVITGGERPSYLFAGRDAAWVRGPHAVPGPMRHALQHARVMLFTLPFWDRERMASRGRPDGRTVFRSGREASAGLSADACRSFLRLVDRHEQGVYERMRPGPFLFVMEHKFRAMVRATVDDFEHASAAVADLGEVPDLVRGLFGRDVSLADLTERGTRLATIARGTRVNWDRALHHLGAARGVPARDLSEREPFVNIHERYENLVQARDLERALEFFGQVLDAIDAAWVRRQRAMSLAGRLVNAEYLNLPNEGLMTWADLDWAAASPGRERLRDYLLGIHRYWADELLRQLERGGVFATVPLEYVLGHADTSEPGLRETITRRGFRITPVELDDGRYVH